MVSEQQPTAELELLEQRSKEEELRWRRVQTEAMLAFSRVHQLILLRSTQLLDASGVAEITPARANALTVLFNARRPVKASELASALGVSEVTVSRMLRRMEEDGWVERAPDPQDGRAMLVRPTASARAEFARLVRVSNHVLDDVFGALGDEELSQLSDVVARIQQRLSDRIGA